MQYTPISVSNRIMRLRDAYRSLPVPMEVDPYVDKKYRGYGTGDRWITLGYLRGWHKYADVATTRLRTSYAEAEELYQSQPLILDDELLLGHLYLPEYSPEEQQEYDELCDNFSMSPHTLLERSPRKDHLSLNFDKLLRLGISGIQAEIRERMHELNLNNPHEYPSYENIKKHEFYQCLLIELDAVMDLAHRYAIAAREKASQLPDPRKTELLRLSDIIERVPATPATNFYEAIQSVQFFLSTLFGLYPLNRPDRYLYPFYVKDLENGTLTKEFAQELIDNFCLAISDRVFSRAACGFIVGGQDAEGNLVENDLTYMFLTALDHLQLPDPNGALAVCRKTSDAILEYSTHILSSGTTHPAFYNDEVIVSSLIENYGCLREDAVEYIHTTCAEISVSGKSRSHTTPYIASLPKLLLETIENQHSYKSFDDLLQKYLLHIKNSVQEMAQNYTLRMLEASRIGSEAMRISALVDDCISRGKSIYEGGERYTFIQPIFVGFANSVDSLFSIRTLVFDEERLSLAQFFNIVQNNYENHEEFRQHIINKLPHYGNDDSAIDTLAGLFADSLVSLFQKEQFTAGKYIMPGTFSYITHATLGSECGATFDGRLNAYSFSDGCSAAQGRDTHGPTAMIKSLTSWNQERLLGGMVVNIKFGKNQLSGDKSKAFITLLKAFFLRGGIEIQVNVVDRQTLLQAQKNPEQHANLMVRIGGYSDYFIRLTPTLQQEIIDRTQY